MNQAVTQATLDGARPVLVTREQKLAAAIAALEVNADKNFKSLDRVEFADEEELRQRPNAGTVLEPITDALGVEQTHGAVMDEFNLSQDQLHQAFCECLFGVSMTGHMAADRLRGVIAHENAPQPARGFSAGF